MLPWESAFKGVTDLFSEYITDQDLKNKLDFEGEKLRFELDKLILSTTTTPRMDAFIKLMVATRDIIIPLFRPLGSVLMAGFAAHCAVNNIVLPEYIQVILFGSPVGYGVSRHADKKEKEKTQRAKINMNWDDI